MRTSPALVTALLALASVAPAQAVQPAAGCRVLYNDLGQLAEVSGQRVDQALGELHGDARHSEALAVRFPSPEEPKRGVFAKLFGPKPEAPLDRAPEVRAFNDALVRKLESQEPRPYIVRVDASSGASHDQGIAALEAEARRIGISEQDISRAIDRRGLKNIIMHDFVRLISTRARSEGRLFYFIADDFVATPANDSFALGMRSWQNDAALDENMRSVVTVLTTRSRDIVTNPMISPYNAARYVGFTP